MTGLDKGLMTPVTIQEIVSSYDNAVKTLDEVCELLAAAQERINHAFPKYDKFGRFDLVDFVKDWSNKEYPRYHDNAAKKFKRLVWNTIFKVTGMRKLMSKKRLEETDKNLTKGELADVTIPNIIDFLTLLQGNTALLAEEVVKEAFEILRPWRKTHKTNHLYEIGKKVILTGQLQNRYNGGFSISHYRQNDLTTLDKAFSLLDGKGIVDGYNSPLADAINTTTAEVTHGETEYFKFKCYLNSNLHLEFKRMDLVKEINRIAGGGNLKPDNANPEQDKYNENSGRDWESVKYDREQKEKAAEPAQEPLRVDPTPAAEIEQEETDEEYQARKKAEKAAREAADPDSQSRILDHVHKIQFKMFEETQTPLI